MRAQASIEIILVVVIALLFSFIALGKYTQVHESVFKNAAAREQIIYAISQSQTEYFLSNIAFSDCSYELRYDITINPTPVGGIDEAIFTQKITDAIRQYSSNPSKDISISFNSPTSLAC